MLIYLIFFLFSLGQVGRISLLNNQINFYLYEQFLLIFFITLFIKNKFKPLIKNRNKFKWILLFLIWIVLTYVTTYYKCSNSCNVIPLLYLLRTGFYFLFIVYSYKFFNLNLKKQINKGILLFIFLTGAFSIIQYFFYPNLRNLIYLGWDPHVYRTFGTFLDTSISSSIYGLILIYLFINYKKIELNKYFKNVLIIIYSILGLLTYSRIFYFSLFITLIYYLISKKKYFQTFLFILIIFTGIFSLPRFQGESTNLKRTYSILSRTNDYNEGITLFKKSPIIGYGYNRLMFIREYKKSFFNYPIHSLSSFQSSFLTIIVSSGIIGLILFILSIFEIGKLNNLLKLSAIFISIFSLGDNVILHPFILFLLLFFVSDS